MRLYQFITFLIWAGITFEAEGQSLGRNDGNVIDSNKIRLHLQVLSSEEMEGRATASAGYDKAASYVVKAFKDAGLLAPAMAGYNKFL